MKKTGRHTKGSNAALSPRSGSGRSAVKPPRVDHLFNIPIDFFELLDEVAIGLMILSLDRKIIGMNQSLKALTGFSHKAVSGVGCAHILRGDVCLLDCPALHVAGNSCRKCVEGDLINRDRQRIPIRITSAPLKNNQGKIIGFLETVEDIRLLRKINEADSHAYNFNNIIGRSPQMENIFHILPSLAQSDSSVLITGETGTGKDMVAETIHHASNRAKGPFVKINCGALPETLLESELFGHRKGAFTGAVENKPGRIQLASNGTLYLTEIGDLPLSLQVKLLTFLDDKEIFPLGSIKGFTADVRIIAATHRNLERWVEEGRFRKDLLYRLNVVRLHLPPLRDRQGDIQLLLDYFLNRLSIQLNKNIRELSPEALKVLLGYHYPGNVRELRNIVEYAANICEGGQIEARHLPAYLLESEPLQWAAAPSRIGPSSPASENESRFVHPRPHQDWPDIEKQMIMEALIKAGGRKHKAAAALGWARSTLWRKMNRYGMR